MPKPFTEQLLRIVKGGIEDQKNKPALPAGSLLRKAPLAVDYENPERPTIQSVLAHEFIELFDANSRRRTECDSRGLGQGS